jgi:hypothetical protein
MSSYTTLSEFASAYSFMPAEVAEFSYGKDAAKQNRTVKAGSTWSIMEAGEYREASPDEAEGIETGLVELAEALAMFGGDLDELEAAVADWHDSQDWYDTQASVRFGFQMF